MKRDIIRRGLAAAACGAMLFSAWKIYGVHAEYAEGDAFYDTLEVSVAEPEATAGTAPISVDLPSLRETNEEVVGWLYCQGTPISYPVVQGDDNVEYLHHMLDGSYNAAGTIFADHRSGSGDRNIVLYGHNMKNGSMFGTLPKYRSQSYYDAHPEMWLLTETGDYKVELLAGFVTSADSESYQMFAEEAELQAYLREIMLCSDFTSVADMEEVQRIVTLSTCSYEYGDARYVLVGSLT